MQTIATDDSGVCLSRSFAEQIEVLRGVRTLEGPRNMVLAGVQIPHTPTARAGRMQCGLCRRQNSI